MGYIRHHTIIITSFDHKTILEVTREAKKIFSSLVSNVIKSMNGFESFFIAPDGSKEGWEDSDFADRGRKQFIKFIKSKTCMDGSNPISFVEIFYGDNDGECKIINHN